MLRFTKYVIVIRDGGVIVNDYDVIIVGGRPAGATLAARLGKRGRRTLLVERATFPSLPAASSPIIYAVTMALLDEIGANEGEYALNTPKIEQVHFAGEAFSTAFDLPEDKGRDYAYAIDRARFDHALWRTAERYEAVTAWQGFHVNDLLSNDDRRVCGITGKNADGEPVTVTADIVVGADGRYSLVARKTDAEIRDEHDELPTSIYYAYWKNTLSFDATGKAVSCAYEGVPGVGYLAMDSADGQTVIAVEGRADLVSAPAGEVEAFYLDMIRQQPQLATRIEGAEMVTKVRGMKRVSNFYREPGGEGWALTGDAYHQKDPLDGQGIYNAVFTAKALAWAIDYYYKGEKTWEEALEWYDETARIKTYAMYKSLLNRVDVSFFNQQTFPEQFQQWMMDDPLMKDLLGRFITRQVPADVMRVMTPAVMTTAIVRGGLRDLRQRVESALPFPFAQR